jgi:hypothetical protein
MKMLNFTSFSETLNEGFTVKNNVVYFDPTSPDFIKTQFGKGKPKNPYQTKIENGVAYSVYNKIKSEKERGEYTEILKALKGQSQVYKMDYDSYRKFISRTAIYMANIITKEKIDVIFVMDSSSPLVSDLTFEIGRRLPKYYETFTFNKQIFKTPDLDSITIETGDVELSPQSLRDLKYSLDKMRREGNFKITNIFSVNRKFVKNWLKINGSVLSKIIDKNVAIIDDFLTSGSTLSEASNLLHDAGAKKIIGLTIIKGG